MIFEKAGYVILRNGSLVCIRLGVSIAWMAASFYLVTYSYVTFLCIKSQAWRLEH